MIASAARKAIRFQHAFPRIVALRRKGQLLVGALHGVIALLVAGCAVGPNFVRPAAPDADRYVPGKARIAASRRSRHARGCCPALCQWRGRVRAVVVRFSSRARSMTWIRQAVDRNPTLQAAEAAIRVAQYNAAAQRGLFFPQLTGNSTSSNQYALQRRHGVWRSRIGAANPIYAGHPATGGVVCTGHLGCQRYVRWKTSTR